MGAAPANRRLTWFRKHEAGISLVTGAMHVLVGFLMITNLFVKLSGALPTFGIWERVHHEPRSSHTPHPAWVRGSLDGLDGGPAVAASDVLNRLWRFLISMRTALVLILALGVP